MTGRVPENTLSPRALTESCAFVPLRQKNNLAFLARIIAISATIGALIAAFRHQGYSLQTALIEGALMGILIGLGCTATDLLSRSTRRGGLARRLPIAALVLFRAAAFGFFILVGLCLPLWVISGVKFWQDPSFGSAFLIAVLVAAIISIIIEITRLLGTEATLSLLTGRYRQPRLEDRIVLFADLTGSTTLAESIGDLRFHAFLGDVALDLSPAIEAARGDVHRYVGDAVIVTWRLSQKDACDAALQCAAQMHQALDSAAPRYLAEFGSAPRLRIALHCGPLAAGEIGDWKKEIALLGDTMNTAARIEAAARAFDTATAVSDDVARLLSAEAKATLTPLPGYAANGKREDLALWGGSVTSVHRI